MEAYLINQDRGWHEKKANDTPNNFAQQAVAMQFYRSVCPLPVNGTYSFFSSVGAGSEGLGSSCGGGVPDFRVPEDVRYRRPLGEVDRSGSDGFILKLVFSKVCFLRALVFLIFEPSPLYGT